MAGTPFIESIEQIDQRATLFINDLDSPLTDRIWMFMSDIEVWIPLYALIVFFLFRRLGWKKALVVTASLAIGFALCDQISNLVKDAVERFRPCWDPDMLSGGLNILEKKGGKYGFFSAHAANTFSLALCAYMGFRNDKRLSYKWVAIGLFAWAFLVSISRVFVGKHYLGDVMVGTMVGLLVGYAMAMLARWVIYKFIDEPATAAE